MPSSCRFGARIGDGARIFGLVRSTESDLAAIGFGVLGGRRFEGDTNHILGYSSLAKQVVRHGRDRGVAVRV